MFSLNDGYCVVAASGPPECYRNCEGPELATTFMRSKEHVGGNRVTHRVLNVSTAMIHEEIRGTAKLVSDRCAPEIFFSFEATPTWLSL